MKRAADWINAADPQGSGHSFLRCRTGAAQADLDPLRGRRQHRVARNLAARAGSRGNGDVGRRGLRQQSTLPDHFQVVQQVAIVR